MSNAKEGAYGGMSTTTGKERKTWDREQFADQAKAKDEEARQRAKERGEALKQGKRPPRRVEDLPKATQLLQAREEPLGLDRNQGKTLIVASGRPGFNCETCRRTFKDSASYLGHVNSRYHLRKLGQTTKVQRSTLQEVQAKIQELREQSKKRMDAKKYDFEQRLKDIKTLEQSEKEARKEKKRLEKQAAENAKQKEVDENADPDMMAMMGFSSFNQ